jgi:hypothetical protein
MKLLYMDAMNMLDEFWDTSRGPCNPWQEFPRFQTRVHEFAEAATTSGYEVIAVIDADAKTHSALKKWKWRQQGALLQQRRRIPLALDGLYADALHQEGIQVSPSFFGRGMLPLLVVCRPVVDATACSHCR